MGMNRTKTPQSGMMGSLGEKVVVYWGQGLWGTSLKNMFELRPAGKKAGVAWDEASMGVQSGRR